MGADHVHVLVGLDYYWIPGMAMNEEKVIDRPFYGVNVCDDCKALVYTKDWDAHKHHHAQITRLLAQLLMRD